MRARVRVCVGGANYAWGPLIAQCLSCRFIGCMCWARNYVLPVGTGHAVYHVRVVRGRVTDIISWKRLCGGELWTHRLGTLTLL